MTWIFRTFYFVRSYLLTTQRYHPTPQKKTRANLITSHLPHDILLRKKALTFDMPKNNTINDNYYGRPEVLVHPLNFFLIK